MDGALLPAVGWSVAACDGAQDGGLGVRAEAGNATTPSATAHAATNARLRRHRTFGWWAIWDGASRDVAPARLDEHPTGAGSSVGTSVRLKSGRSAVRPRPCPLDKRR